EERRVGGVLFFDLSAQLGELGVVFAQRPITPSGGDEAEAYIRRGMRPARNASRPASTAFLMAAAMRTGSRASAMAVFMSTPSAPSSMATAASQAVTQPAA